MLDKLQPKSPKKPQLIRLHTGDVITSPDLVYCRFVDWDYKNRRPKTKCLNLNRGHKTSKIQHTIKWNEERDGRRYKCEENVVDDQASNDPTRSQAKFLVESAGWSGGSHGSHGGRDDYPDGWGLSLRRLDDDGSYSPESEIIDCYENDTGCFVNQMYITAYEIVGKMKKNFVKVEPIDGKTSD